MKILCPNCKKNTVDLNYLEHMGSQTKTCDVCKSLISAKYDQNDYRKSWEVGVEHPLKATEEPKKQKSFTKRPWPRFWIVLIILWILFTAWAKLSK